MKKALVITPDMELNGAQTVLSELLLLLEDTYSISMISPSDGKYKKMYNGRGYSVEIRPYVVGDRTFRHRLQTEYDLVLMNSSSVTPYIYYFINTDVNVLWWLHESKPQLVTENNMINPQLLSENIRIFGVTEAVKAGINELYGFDIDILHAPIAECREDYVESEVGIDVPSGKTIFFIPAAFTPIKGQDVLLKTILSLSESMMDKAEFVFSGYQLPGQEAYYKDIKNIISRLPNVIDLGSIERNEVYNWYNKCDCVIAPSRVDSLPTSIIESLMFKKYALVSNNTGISYYMKDCVNGFVFGNEEELLKRIMLIIEDGKSLGEIAEAGYGLYKERFSPEAVKAVLQKEGYI